MSPDEARRLLELSPHASEQELLGAYRDMLRVWHPDRFQEGSQLHEVATARTRRVIEAFQVLKEEGVGATGEEPVPPCPASGRDPYAPARAPLRFDEPTPEKTRPQVQPRRRLSRRLVAAVAVAAVATVAGVGAAFSLSEPSAAAFSLGEPSAAATEDLTERKPIAPAPPVARYSMAIGSFRDPDRARALAATVAARAPDVWTTVVPVEVRGAVFYRVLAGMSVDLASLDGTVELLRVALGEDPGAWTPREAGLTFCLAETDSLEDAGSVTERARRFGIETFALRVASADGGEVLRVCAGSYEGREEAAYLERALMEAGFDAVPRARSGEPLATELDAS